MVGGGVRKGAELWGWETILQYLLVRKSSSVEQANLRCVPVRAMTPPLAALQVEKLTEQMAEVLQRLAALESIKVAGGGRSPPVRATGLALSRKPGRTAVYEKPRGVGCIAVYRHTIWQLALYASFAA